METGKETHWTCLALWDQNDPWLENLIFLKSVLSYSKWYTSHTNSSKDIISPLARMQMSRKLRFSILYLTQCSCIGHVIYFLLKYYTHTCGVSMGFVIDASANDLYFSDLLSAVWCRAWGCSENREQVGGCSSPK